MVVAVNPLKTQEGISSRVRRSQSRSSRQSRIDKQRWLNEVPLLS